MTFYKVKTDLARKKCARVWKQLLLGARFVKIVWQSLLIFLNFPVDYFQMGKGDKQVLILFCFRA